MFSVETIPLVIEPKIEKLDFSSKEAIHMLRENVQMAGYRCQTLSVTSALPNEGKSYIAFRLAHSLAVLGKKTVYVDCDIRNSMFKKKCGITEKTIGLSDYLCGQCEKETLSYPTTIDNLSFVFSGKKSPNPSELLSGEQFGELLDYLKEKYDYIILDTPPVNVVVDATIISKKADATVLVIKSCSTDRAEAMQMKKQLELSGVKVLGVVVNLHEVQKTGYGKYGYGRYGYGKYGYGKYGYGNSDHAKRKKKSVMEELLHRNRKGSEK